MLKTILAISGKPGLFRMVSRGNKMLIVETLDENRKRMPAYGTYKVVSLADISIYTENDDEISLASVFDSIKKNYNGAAVDMSPKKASNEDMIAFFEKVLPEYDRDRVRVSDMRKVLSWYNILIAAGVTEFVPEEKETAESAEEAEKAE